MSNIARPEFRSELATIESQQFEEFIAELWELDGWETQVTGVVEENAIDVIAVKNELIQRKDVIQIKQLDSDKLVTPSAVRNCNSSRHYQQNADSSILITNTGFSDDAEILADNLNVKTVSGEGLYEHLVESNRFDYFYEYI